MKRRISLLWTCAALICLACALMLTARAAERTVVKTGSCGANVSYRLWSDGELVIAGTGPMNHSFQNIGSTVPSCPNVTTVTVMSGVTSISYRAFAFLPVTSVSLPTTLTAIADFAFMDCDLQSITLPTGLVSIGAGAFSSYGYDLGESGCPLVSVDFPEGLESIGEEAFAGCSSLTTISLPVSLRSIGENAFSGCPLIDTYYAGTQEQFSAVTIESGNGMLYAGLHVYVPVTGVTLDAPQLALSRGESAALTAAVVPADATEPAVTWSSSDPAVAAVNGGTVTATGAGSAVITAMTADGGFTAQCTVTVTVPVTGITLSKTALTLRPGAAATVTAAVSPADATDPTVTWSSSDPAVATVVNGAIIAVGEGTATITASAGGVTAECAVTVSDTALISDPDAPTITVSAVTARPGQTVEVPLTLEKNSGLVGAVITAAYDPSLVLTAVADGEALAGLTFTAPGDLSANPFNLTWIGTDAVAGNGTLATLSFTVPEGTADGTYTVTLTCEPDGCCDDELNDVAVTLIAGGVTVRSRTPGDLSGDGKVNAKDAVLLQRSLAGGYGATLTVDEADLTHDGKVNAKDAVLLQRFIAGGYGVTLE